MIEIWKINRGDLFKIPDCDVILEFCGMDGAYAKCSTLTGQATLVRLCKVELIQGK